MTRANNCSSNHKNAIFAVMATLVCCGVPSGHGLVPVSMKRTTATMRTTTRYRLGVGVLVYMNQGQAADNNNNNDSRDSTETSVPFFLRTDEDENATTSNVASSDIPFVVQDMVDRATDLASDVTRQVKKFNWEKVKANVDAFTSRQEVQGIRDSTVSIYCSLHRCSLPACTVECTYSTSVKLNNTNIISVHSLFLRRSNS